MNDGPLSPAATPLSDEFAGADLGDVRLSRRLQRIVGGLETDPSQSFPKAAGSDAVAATTTVCSMAPCFSRVAITWATWACRWPMAT